MMVVRVPGPRASDASAQDGDPDEQHEQARGQVQPRVELLGQHVGRQRERHQPEGEDADRVGHGDDRPERHRVARRSPRPDEVGGDHRLAVSRRERVQRAPPERGQQQEDEDPLAGGGVGEGAAQPLGDRAAGPVRGAVLAVGRRHGPQAGADRQAGHPAVGRLVEQVAGVGAQAAGRVGRRHARAHGRALARADDHRPPADAAGEGAVADDDGAAGRRRARRTGCSARVVRSPPWPIGKLMRPGPRARSATSRPATRRRSPPAASARLRASTVAGAVPRSRKVGISAWSST